MKTNLELRQIRDFGQIIADTFVFFKENFKPLFRAIAVISGFFIVLTIITNVLMESTTLAMVKSSRSIYAGDSRPTFFDMYTADYFLRLIFVLVSTMLAYISVYLTTFCYIVIYREKGNQPATVTEVWGYFKFYFFRFFGSGILLYIIAAFSMLLCFSGIYLIPAFSIFFPIMIIENSSFSYAFNRGFKLVNNYWWQTFGVFFIFAIILFFIGIIMAIPGQILLTLQVLVSTKGVVVPVTILSGVLKSLAIFCYALPATAYCLSYFSLVEVKEGAGLLDRIDMLGKADPNDITPTEEY